MKIRYLDGNRLYYAFIAGGQAVIRDRSVLNKINVFPVPDADTGTNLASTMKAIADKARAFRSARRTLGSIADAALLGARGNSGLIFAQFVYGLSQEVKNEVRLTTRHFGESVRKAVRYARDSILTPVEGTMLTLIHDWAEAVFEQRLKMGDFSELLAYALRVAEGSLEKTPDKLAVLREAGVVDAGAKGFVDFLQGVAAFIRKGDIKNVLKSESTDWAVGAGVHAGRSFASRRFCTEALLEGDGIDVAAVRAAVQAAGESAIVAGSPAKVRFHVHTDDPPGLFFKLRSHGTVRDGKAEDMLRQYQAVHSRLSPVAVLTDSACDLPAEILDEHQIHVIPFTLSFGESQFLDKFTMSPEQFYSLLGTEREMPRTAQPSQTMVRSQMEFLAGQYDAVVAVAISSGLTGLYGQLIQARASLGDRSARITVIDSRHLSVSQALVVLRIAEAVRAGRAPQEIAAAAEAWIEGTRLWVDIKTLKYMVRGGRVSPLKGLVASLLNIKPVIVLNAEGRAKAAGKSFSRRGNMRKILRMIRRECAGRAVWNYALVHARNPFRALRYADELAQILGRKPAFISEVSPAIGVHNGIGVVGIALMFD